MNQIQMMKVNLNNKIQHFYKLFFKDCSKLLNSNSLQHSCYQHIYSTPSIFFLFFWKS